MFKEALGNNNADTNVIFLRSNRQLHGGSSCAGHAAYYFKCRRSSFWNMVCNKL